MSPPDHIEPTLWDHRIDELGIVLQDGPLWPLVQTVQAELAAAGLTFRPKFYVGCEWGCPDGEPIIALPFFLADARFHAIEEAYADDLEDDRRILMGLRHELGHAFLYAYRLYQEPEWAKVFGDFAAEYDDDYLPEPFDSQYVRHLPGWYSHKHPDEDFAETFAVWLTPGSDWKVRYAGTRAATKLEYIDAAAGRLSQRSPEIDPQTMVPDPGELAMTLRAYYSERQQEDAPDTAALGTSIDADLHALFDACHRGNAAGTLLEQHRRVLMHNVSNYAGARLYVVKQLVDFVVGRTRALNLRSEPATALQSLIGVTALLCTLTANYLETGCFVRTEESDEPAATRAA